MSDEELIEHLKKQGKVFSADTTPVQELKLQQSKPVQSKPPQEEPILTEPTLPGWERLKAANERFKQDTLMPLNVEETDTDE